MFHSSRWYVVTLSAGSDGEVQLDISHDLAFVAKDTAVAAALDLGSGDATKAFGVMEIEAYDWHELEPWECVEDVKWITSSSQALNAVADEMQRRIDRWRYSIERGEAALAQLRKGEIPRAPAPPKEARSDD